MEDQETLETCALISQLADTVKNNVDNFLANSIVATSVVVGCVFLTSDHLFGVEQLTVHSSSDLINNRRFQINKDCPGYVLARTSLAEESVEGVIGDSNGLVRGHLAIRLDAVLKA